MIFYKGWNWKYQGGSGLLELWWNHRDEIM